jgi:hypothetical protein
LDSEELDEYMEDIEERDELESKLKIPKDLAGDANDRYNMANDEDEENDSI